MKPIAALMSGATIGSSQLLYMMCDIGVSVSMSSNHYLFLDYSENPIRDFFETGMRISVSTDDGPIFHARPTQRFEEIWKDEI